ncbi:hypothetical protein ACFCW6_15065 [Streptomyces sp. NPDC056333]|uniref:hypothetical protein n=1 Tax=Streptomyces sp. NPDC056333 TaxID=3345786 RepID=UPI0035DB7AED
MQRRGAGQDWARPGETNGVASLLLRLLVAAEDVPDPVARALMARSVPDAPNTAPSPEAPRKQIT